MQTMSRQKSIQSSLQQSNKKNIPAVQHDVKSHITVIKLFVLLLRKDLPQTKKNKEYLDKIDQRANEIIAAIEELN